MNGFPQFLPNIYFMLLPCNKNAKIEVKVTDRFGNVYTEAVENK